VPTSDRYAYISVDATRLAAAMSLGPDLGVVVTYDDRMLAAASLFGLPVASPC